jgi:hypothetical protein
MLVKKDEEEENVKNFLLQDIGGNLDEKFYIR